MGDDLGRHALQQTGTGKPFKSTHNTSSDYPSLNVQNGSNGPQIFAVDPVQAAVDKVVNNVNGVLESTAAGASNNNDVQSIVDRVFNHIQKNIVEPYEQKQAELYNQQLISPVTYNVDYDDPEAYINAAKQIAEMNTNTSQALAREQMSFQEKANAKAMNFSASEAQKTRDWVSLMSDTAHQREVRDLIASGLNPILSANQGASTGSAASAQGVTSAGAKGTVDMSAVDAVTNVYSKLKELEMQERSLNMQEKQIAAQIAMNQLSNDTNRYMADTSAGSQRYSAELSSSASRYGSFVNSEAHKYAANLDYQTYANGWHNQYVQLGNAIAALVGRLFPNQSNSGKGVVDEVKDLITPNLVKPNDKDYYNPYGSSVK